MTRDQAIRKAKACLRLAASSNPHEAAAALRQAQALMAAYSIDHAEISDVTSAEVGTRSRGAEPPSSIVMLCGMCATGFGAEVIVLPAWRKTTIRFYGMQGAAEIAAYAFTVLRRQMDADRLKHISRVRKRGNREARGETFALAWVLAVRRLFPDAKVPEERRLAVQDVLNLKHPSAGTSAGRDLTKRGKAGDRDSEAGWLAGRQATLNTGLNGTKAPAPAQLPSPSRIVAVLEVPNG